MLEIATQYPGGKLEFADVITGTAAAFVHPGTTPIAAEARMMTIAPTPHLPIETTPRTQGEHVLLAEDDGDLRPLFAAGLRRAGYSVTVASDGREMLALFSAAARREILRPDVVVMDIRMPHFTGLELLVALKRAEWSVPVILMTGFGDSPTHVRAYRLGAYELLDKPVSTSRLAASIRRALLDSSIHF